MGACVLIHKTSFINCLNLTGDFPRRKPRSVLWVHAAEWASGAGGPAPVGAVRLVDLHSHLWRGGAGVPSRLSGDHPGRAGSGQVPARSTSFRQDEDLQSPTLPCQVIVTHSRFNSFSSNYTIKIYLHWWKEFTASHLLKERRAIETLINYSKILMCISDLLQKLLRDWFRVGVVTEFMYAIISLTLCCKT